MWAVLEEAAEGLPGRQVRWELGGPLLGALARVALEHLQLVRLDIRHLATEEEGILLFPNKPVLRTTKFNCIVLSGLFLFCLAQPNKNIKIPILKR